MACLPVLGIVDSPSNDPDTGILGPLRSRGSGSTGGKGRSPSLPARPLVVAAVGRGARRDGHGIGDDKEKDWGREKFWDLRDDRARRRGAKVEEFIIWEGEKWRLRNLGVKFWRARGSRFLAKLKLCLPSSFQWTFWEGAT